eukprot:Em0016g527a
MSTEQKSSGAQIWMRLPTETQELFRPLLTSSYSASISERPTSAGSIFKCSKPVSYHVWVQKWTAMLIHQLEDSFAKSLLLPCSLIFKHDIHPAIHVVPHVLTLILSQGTAGAQEQIHKEIMAVLNYCAHSKNSSHDSSHACVQTIFGVLDHLKVWLRKKFSSGDDRKPKDQRQTAEMAKVQDFLKSIPQDVLALSAFRCRAFARSLMYIESYLQANRETEQRNLGFLQRLYVSLNEADSIAGIAALKNSEPSLTDQITRHESEGNYRASAACYERAIQLEPDAVEHHEGLLRCIMQQGELTSALMHANGILSERPHWMQSLNSYRIQAAWRLGQWKELEELLKMEPPGTTTWDVNLGKLLLLSKQGDYGGFKRWINKVRREQMDPLSTVCLEQNSYQRGYDYILRLHMLQELQDAVSLLQIGNKESMDQILNSWHPRLKAIEENFRVQEGVLSLRRVILGLADSHFENDIGQYWLKSAKIARRAGYMQTAHSLLLSASGFSLPKFCLEKAKWMKSEGGSHEALLALEKSIQSEWPDVGLTPDENKVAVTVNSTCAKAMLLIGQWMEETAHYDQNTILKQYKKVVAVNPESEDGHFFLGKYYDRLMSVVASDRLTKSGEFLQFIVRHYGHALEFGNKYIYHCMPRMLSLWMDFGANIPEGNKRNADVASLRQTITSLNELMTTLTTKLPSYQFLAVFAQIISRICHPNAEVFAKLEAIILKVIEQYPQQSLWMMMAVNKSTHPERQSRCKKILERAKHQLPHTGKLIENMVRLCDRLLEVCNKPVDSGKTYQMDKISRGLIRLTSNSDFSPIMVPLQSSLTITLPVGHGCQPEHNPFPGFQPFIDRFNDKVEILSSLQKPKKIVIHASDGKEYTMMCKPKDDLRKDSRLMEFNALVNKYLHKDPDCRHRRLYIRTYAVIPLNEECGLLEWVPNTHGFRNIIQKLYQEKGIQIPGKKVREMIEASKSDPQRLKDLFVKQLLPMHPPVFGEWFLNTFTEPTAWYCSRLGYARTAAVMSMVGYILGLGDRHGENILFDSTNGDCVHVDFNCLFNRGETFDVPEVVPFRLTQNMIHAMGITGYEGVFRKSCEVTMKVMRKQCEPLMCVLKTFIHDPLVEWEKVKGKTGNAESSNEKALKIVKDIEERLQGKYHKVKGLPLSVEGHVHALIKTATDEDNLCRMYVGWAPFM